MTQKHNTLSLLAPQATGGDNAEGGFQYQINWTIARIPIWLAQNGFTEMIREALGDVEAKFFNPSGGFQCEFVEYKNHLLTPSEFWKEIENFWEKDQQNPDVYQRFVLACTSVSDNLRRMINALRRVRDAYPFYDGAQQIQDPSYDGFVKIVKDLKQTKEMANFLFLKVHFEIDLTDAEDHPLELFRETLSNHFPTFEHFAMKVSRESYSRLLELVRSRKNQPIDRLELENAIWSGVAEKKIPEPTIRIHTSHDENTNKDHDGCLKFDWKRFFGGTNRNFPPAEEWNRKVIGELQATKEWLIKTRRWRRICLSGHRRLSTSIAIGSTFSAVSGFTIGMETKDGIWWTNSHAKENTPDYQWIQKSVDGKSTNEIAVGISILKDTANKEVERYLETQHFRGNQLYLFSNMALQSDAQANQAVKKVKSMIEELTSKTQAKKTHLFFAGPAHFALFLGHRLNTLGKIQCYERTQPNKYVPTVLIET